MFYILFNEKTSKVVVTKNESDMFDLLIGDCLMIGTTTKKEDIEKRVFDYWHDEITDNERVVS